MGFMDCTDFFIIRSILGLNTAKKKEIPTLSPNNWVLGEQAKNYST